MAQAIREERAIRGAVAIAMRPDGTRRAFTPYPTPLFDDDGKLIGAVNMLIDVTAEQAACSPTRRSAAAASPTRPTTGRPAAC